MVQRIDTVMRATDFQFELPSQNIAQTPAPERDQARLYVLPRHTGGPEHRRVAELPLLLPRDALVIFNNTRVIPARLRARKSSGGRVELLLVERLDTPPATPAPIAWVERWRCLAGASKPMRPGMQLHLEGEERTSAEVLSADAGEVELCFRGTLPGGVPSLLDRIGEIPLPPYIERQGPPGPHDRARYQTVYAQVPGAVAAPTAGLHFTDTLLAALVARGIRSTALTLHVGLGTFAPLRSDDLDPIETLHEERFEISTATALAFERARAEQRPIIAIGTTTIRALESACDDSGRLRTGPGRTRLFIKPGYRFRAVDGLLTNFHLPQSTLLMLVCAFAGQHRVLAAYRDAVQRGYRFYSYGDAMLIV